MTKLSHAEAARQGQIIEQRQQLSMMLLRPQLCYGAATEGEVNACLDAERVVCEG